MIEILYLLEFVIVIKVKLNDTEDNIDTESKQQEFYEKGILCE